MSRKAVIITLSCALYFSAQPSYALTVGPVDMEVLVRGMTKNIDLYQEQVLPFGCPHFFVLTVGSGFLGISVTKYDVPGEAIFMTGLVSAGGKVTPVYRAGSSNGMIDQIIEIDGDEYTLGLIWLWAGVAYSQHEPPYACQVRFSLEP